MKWVKFRIKTVTEAEDIIISTLYDLGLEGAQIEDKVPLTAMEKEQMFVDILPQTEADDGVAYLSFYLEPEEDKEKILSDVRKGTAWDPWGKATTIFAVCWGAPWEWTVSLL